MRLISRLLVLPRPSPRPTPGRSGRKTPRRGVLATLLTSLALALALPHPTRADGPPPDLPDWVFAVLPEDENLDVLHFGESRPTLIRFRIRIDGQGFRSAWDSCLARLSQYVDANDDGLLTEAEVARPAWRQLIGSSMNNFNAFTGSYPTVGTSGYGPKGGRVSVEAFRMLIREGLGQGPIRVQVAHASDPIDQATFNQFDQDRDGSLSAAELSSTAADAILRRLDVDEDEVVDRLELEPNRSPLAGIFSTEGGSVEGDPLAHPLMALTSPESRSRAARRLLSRYDGADSTAKDGRLSPLESGFAAQAFRLADSDDDDRLDLLEIERYLDAPTPEIVLVLRMTRQAGQPSRIAALADGERPSPPDPRVSNRPDGDWTINLDGRQARVSPVDSVSDFRTFYGMRFQLSDFDKDGSLDRAEATKGLYFVRLFDSADRNVDDRLSRVELDLYFQHLFDISLCRATIQLSEDGRPVFDTLDADSDGRLGRRELRNASQRLKSFDSDGDGRIRLAEITTTTRLRVGRGQAGANRNSGNFDSYDSPPPARQGDAKNAVAWFRKMDRNRDGDVSATEFLGPADLFHKLDDDGDGLIDESEASKGP
jgi:Ca2+-binding EF-hand superfamily protein